MPARSVLKSFILLTLLAGCSEKGDQQSEVAPVRGVKTMLVAEQESTTTREYPSVLQPASLTVLAFEVGGKLSEFNVTVGQTVKAGDVIAQLDTNALQLQVESAEAAVDQAKATNGNAEADYSRKAQLQKEGIISKAELDQSTANVRSSRSQVKQAEKQLASAVDQLGKGSLIVPFDAIVNSVEVEPYSTVGAATPIVSLYSSAAFEASFSVSFDIVNRLAVGKPVIITLADRPDTQLQGVISELGSRADTVSSFPVVVSLQELLPSLKAGMAVGIGIEFAVATGEGYALPFQALAMKTVPEPGQDFQQPVPQSLYVFDPDTSTVKERAVTIGGIQGNNVIVVSGLQAGERVATAGVSFLRDGQAVKLLDQGE